jgi:hypothetical protein
MTDWKYNVYLADLFDEFYERDDDADESDLKRIVQGTCDRLVMLANEIKKREANPSGFLNGTSGLNFIIDDLEFFDYDLDYEEQLEEFDRILSDLYDFADWNLIWINTFDEIAEGIGKP